MQTHNKEYECTSVNVTSMQRYTFFCRRLKTVAVSTCWRRRVSLSVCIHQRHSHLAEFREISYRGERTKNLSRKSNSGWKISDTKNVYIVIQQYAIFCRSKRVQSETTLAFPWRHWKLLHSALTFRVTRTRHNVTLYVQCLSCYIQGECLARGPKLLSIKIMLLR